MLVKCEVNDCIYNTYFLQRFVCNKEEITIGHGNKNGEWVFAECMDYMKKPSQKIIWQNINKSNDKKGQS